MKRYIVLILLLLAAACKPAAPELPATFLKAGLTDISAPGFAVDYNLEIVSNIGWRISSNDVYDWVAPSLTSSRGSASLTLSLSANEGPARSGDIVLESDDNSIKETIHVAQRPLSEDGVARIREIRALERPGSYTIIQGKIKGFVVSDPASSNYPENTFALEDAIKEEMSGISVCVQTGSYVAPARGSEVVVDLAGASLERSDDGVLTLFLKSNPVPGDATPFDMVADTVSFAGLSGGAYESMYVCLSPCQVVEDAIGGVLASSPRLTDEAQTSFARMVVSADAPFASAQYARGGGAVSGVAGAVKAGIADIRPMSEENVRLTAKRLGEKPGITGLPYVFSFYCSTQTDGACKYIRYNKLQWDPATSMTSGKIAEDRDESIGASLWIAAFAAESGNVYGPNMWAEAGAHDNVNAAGFVSQECTTTPTAECGWWLDVPLTMTLPQRFTVTFGMGGNTWSLRNWTLYYSKDRQNWYEGGDFSMDHIIDGGSYYLFHKVAVDSELSFAKGDVLYLKFSPRGSAAIGGSSTADGHGKSCFIRLHSAIIISEEAEGSTPAPSGAVWFEPFDRLTGGVDYMLGDRIGGLANYTGAVIGSWSEEQLGGMSGHDVYERPGYAQIGFVDTERAPSRKEYTNVSGALESPALGVSGDVTLSFEAAAYRSPAIRTGAASSTPDVGSPDSTTGILEIIGDGTVNGASSAKILQMSATREFSTHTFTIKGVSPSTRLRFTSAPADGEFSRWFIDNISVTK